MTTGATGRSRSEAAAVTNDGCDGGAAAFSGCGSGVGEGGGGTDDGMAVPAADSGVRRGMERRWPPRAVFLF